MDEKPIDESSAADNLDDCKFPRINMKQSSVTNTKGKVWSAFVDKEGKNHSVNKTRMKKMDEKPMDQSSDTDVHEIAKEKDTGNDCYVEKETAVKCQESTKGNQKDDSGSVDAILDSIINNEGIHGEKGDNRIPLIFRFDDSDDESLVQKDNGSNGEELFEEMNFVLECEEIGSYRTPMVSFFSCVAFISVILVNFNCIFCLQRLKIGRKMITLTVLNFVEEGSMVISILKRKLE